MYKICDRGLGNGTPYFVVGTLKNTLCCVHSGQINGLSLTQKSAEKIRVSFDSVFDEVVLRGDVWNSGGQR